MMIVVLGDEEGQINHTYLHLQAWMQRGSLDECCIILIKPTDELHSFSAKRGEDVFDSVCVVIRFVRPAILQVGGVERLASSFVIVEAIHSKLFKVEQMPGLFLDRPLVAVAPCQYFSWQRAREVFEPRGSSAQS